MNMAIFKGAGVAIITPFHKDGSVNYDKLEELIDFQCNNGTDSIVICGTTGESATLSEEEHIKCIKMAVEFTKGRIPVVAGTGSNSTHTAIELSREAEAAGADGLLIVTPYYNKATQQGLIQHYTAIAKEVKAPIIMYSVASRTGCNIEPATAASLVKNVENIVGIKEASGNISQVAKIMNLTDLAPDSKDSLRPCDAGWNANTWATELQRAKQDLYNVNIQLKIAEETFNEYFKESDADGTQPTE